MGPIVNEVPYPAAAFGLEIVYVLEPRIMIDALAGPNREGIPMIEPGNSTASHLLRSRLFRVWLAACAFIYAGLAHTQPMAPVPAVDLSRHSVPLDAIYFDTFRRDIRAVPLTLASQGLIAHLRDAIPPLHHPKYESRTAADWLTNDDIVIGYAAGDQAWAYPTRILNFHEIVNDTLAGEPVLIAYCPLCASGFALSRRLDDRVLTFGNTSALYQSDMVMLDYETGSYWWHVAGQAIVGTLTGARLTTLPAITTTWEQWQTIYPHTKVLSRDTGHRRPYENRPFARYADMLNRGRFAFPVSGAARDGRLSPATTVLGVKVGDAVRAYRLDDTAPNAIMDSLGDQRLVVFTAGGGTGGAAYKPVARGQKLTFVLRQGKYTDQETGSVWNLAGTAIDGSLKGTNLIPLPTKTSFWFALVAAEPDITVYEAVSGQ